MTTSHDDSEAVRLYWERHSPKFKFGDTVHYLKEFIVNGSRNGHAACVVSISTDGEQFRYDIEFNKTHYRLEGVREKDLRAHLPSDDAEHIRLVTSSASNFWCTYKRKFRDGERVRFVGSGAKTATAATTTKYGRVQALHDSVHERNFATDFHYAVAYDDGTFETYEAERNLQRCR